MVAAVWTRALIRASSLAQSLRCVDVLLKGNKARAGSYRSPLVLLAVSYDVTVIHKVGVGNQGGGELVFDDGTCPAMLHTKTGWYLYGVCQLNDLADGLLS